MDIGGLRTDLRTCIDHDDILDWLRDNASVLCSVFGGAGAIAALGLWHQNDTDEHWRFMLWISGKDCTIFTDRVLPALGFEVSFTTPATAHGCQSHVKLRKTDFPTMQFCEAFSA